MNALFRNVKVNDEMFYNMLLIHTSELYKTDESESPQKA